MCTHGLYGQMSDADAGSCRTAASVSRATERGRVARLLHQPTLCYGCRTCELVCSLHHTGAFQPERSSVHVTRQPRSGTVRWRVDRTCDHCRDESQPLCVKYCAYDALLMERE
jgi:Fe-S-cluster-containing dehydrogenase component